MEEIEEELRTHLALRAEDNRHAGMSEAEAEANALARFGDVEHITAACVWAEKAHPARYAARLVVTGVLFALAFGTFAAAFSLTWAVWFRPLRLVESDRLVRAGAGWENARVPFGQFEAWRAQSRSFEHVTAFRATVFNEGGDDALRAMLVTSDYFQVFEAVPIIGRTFGNMGDREVLIGEALWARRFQRSRSAFGKSIYLDGEAHTVVGVMPEAAQLSHRVDVWRRFGPRDRTVESSHFVAGRLREGVTLAALREEIAALSARPDLPLFYPLKRLYATAVRPRARLALAGAILALVLLGGLALRLTYVRARRAALYGGGSEDPAVQFVGTLAASGAGLGLAHALQVPIYRGCLGQEGWMLDGALDAPVILVVLLAGCAVGAALALSVRRGSYALPR